MIASICSEPAILEVMRIVNIIINIIRIVVPILLIFILIFKLIQGMTSGANDSLAKVKKSVPSNVIAAALIFFIPVLVRLIVRLTFPNTDYENCLKIVSKEEIQLSYEEKLNKLISSAENTLNINDYNNAINYLNHIKDNDKRKNYEQYLATIKEKIDEKNKVVDSGNGYANVNYSNFKWTYFNRASGPNAKYYSNTIPYAIWAPDNVSDLNGVSLPLIVWLHGSGEVVENGKQAFLNSGLLQVMSNWKNYNLDNVPAIIVAPQSSGYWGKNENYETIKALINLAKDNYNIDTSNVVLMGHSMGGNGVIYVSNELKNTFSKLVIMSSSVSGAYGDKEYYSNIPMKGYGEYMTNKAFFDWAGQSENFISMSGISHGDIPLQAMIQDKDEYNGISDLVYWMFGKNESGNNESLKPINRKILWLGDSRTQAYGSIKNELGFDDEKEAIYARYNTGWDDFFHNQLNFARSDINNSSEGFAVTVNYGINALYRKNHFCYDYQQFVKNTIRDNDQFYIISVTPSLPDDGRVEEFNNYMKNTCLNSINKDYPSKQAFYCDIYNIMPIEEWKKYISEDGDHYNTEGYKIIYNEIKKCISKHQ